MRMHESGSRRHPSYYAPTWSWASITGSISFLHRDNAQLQIRLKDVGTEAATTNPFGPVKRGHVSLCGFLIPVALEAGTSESTAGVPSIIAD